ncbi:FRG domain-containing protein [Knoellia subterranea]|uniref:FRG domain-containing protein n=1 Tax=Knoellia subterranea TaxID=184882 RepID=UPI000A00D9A9
MFFRGQSKLYAHATPSLFRGRSQKVIAKHTRLLNAYVEELSGGNCSCPWYSGQNWYSKSHECSERLDVNDHGGSVASGTYRAAVEPLLQHYGVATRWIDAVDNIWVALWFACHEQVTKNGYAYHLKRSRETEAARTSHVPYAYVYMLETGTLASTNVPGYDISEETRLIDLRYCVPSIYLRPHAQHGVLLARRRLSPRPDAINNSLDHAVAGVIRVRLSNALDWLGDGALTNHFTLFPPAVHDVGYRRLMSGPSPDEGLGAIVIYQGGA